jgi:hypothetical protein
LFCRVSSSNLNYLQIYVAYTMLPMQSYVPMFYKSMLPILCYLCKAMCLCVYKSMLPILCYLCKSYVHLCFTNLCWLYYATYAKLCAYVLQIYVAYTMLPIAKLCAYVFTKITQKNAAENFLYRVLPLFKSI